MLKNISDTMLHNINTDNEKCFLKIGEKVQLFEKKNMEIYISNIFDKMRISHLDLKKIVEIAYPKLKKVNTLQDIKKIIVTCSMDLIFHHTDYGKIASFIMINDLHKVTDSDYMKVATHLRKNKGKNNKKIPLVNKNFYNYVKKHIDTINNALKYENDYIFSPFGIKTLEKSYLKKRTDGTLIERPQHMWMRTALAIHMRSDRIDLAIETYKLMSEGFFYACHSITIQCRYNT